jgi:hypothetical protein
MKLHNLFKLVLIIVIPNINGGDGQLHKRFTLSLDVDTIAYQEHMRMLYKQPEFRKTFNEMDKYYYQASECTIAIPEDTVQNFEAFADIFDPELVLISSQKSHDLETWREHYCEFLSKHIKAYSANLASKKIWLGEQTKPFATLLFIMKKWSQALARFTIGCACYVVGGFTAKYAIQEKELKNLATSLGLFAGGSVCIGQAAVALAECIHYKKIVEAHLDNTESHSRYLKKKNKQLQLYLAKTTEKQQSKNNSQTESPLIPRTLQNQFEEGTI